MPRPAKVHPRSGLLTVPGLPEPWTRERTRAHNSLDAGQRTPASTAPLENRHAAAGFPHRQQAAHNFRIDLLEGEELR